MPKWRNEILARCYFPLVLREDWNIDYLTALRHVFFAHNKQQRGVYLSDKIPDEYNYIEGLIQQRRFDALK